MTNLNSYLAFLGVLAVNIAVLTGCARAPSAPRVAALPTPRVIASTDGKCSLTIPSGWAEDNELYPGAELQVSNKKEELFVVILSEPRKDFEEMTRDKYSRITRRALANSLRSVKTAGPTKPSVAGTTALQYQIAGKLDGMDVVYLHTAVEGKRDFHQILAWTTKSKFDAARATLDQIIASFRETEAAGTANKP